MTDRLLLLTAGHGTHPEAAFADLLRSAGVESIVDVRIAPGSRRFPHFGRGELERWLPAAGISYRWERRLGGYRKLPPDSPDVGLRNASFRAYAAHMRSPEFAAAMEALALDVAARRTAIMCSESVWWRCHRRLIADHAELIEQLQVRHVMPDGKLAAHEITDGVQVIGTQLRYGATHGTDPLPFGPSD